MTRLSAPTLYQCPACAGYFTRSVLTSLHYHNNVKDWSDGMSGQWWADVGGPVGRCPECRSVVWIDDAQKVMQAPTKPRPIGTMARLWHRVTGDRSVRLRDEREWNEVPLEIKEAKSIAGLHSAKDYIDALALLPTDAEDREVYLRRRLWWASNDHQRLRTDGTPVAAEPVMAPTESHANMLRLLVMVEHDPKQQVERGELLRQLGRFDEAMAVLKAVEPNGYTGVKAVRLEGLARAGIAELQAFA